jgi:nucleotide-binding universal stress UspA family protein
MQRLLIATDLTEGSHFALGRAVRLAARAGAALRILCALPTSASEAESADVSDMLHQQAWEMADDLDHEDLEVSVRMSNEKPEQAILQEADRFDADLIVLGAHGEPNIRDAIFGTTATHVVKNSGRPALIVQNSDALPYAKIMVAVEDALSARDVLRLALEVAPEGEIFAVHAFEPSLGELVSGDDLLQETRFDQQAILDATIREIAPDIGERRASAKSHSVVEKGDVMSVIEHSWSDIKPDLVLMGTHGRSGLARIVKGSFADDVLIWCRSDILVMRNL